MTAGTLPDSQDTDFRSKLRHNLNRSWDTCGKMLNTIGIVIPEPSEISLSSADNACTLINTFSEEHGTSKYSKLVNEIRELIVWIALASDLIEGNVTLRPSLDEKELLIQMGFQIGYIFRLHSLFQYNDDFLNILESSVKFDRVKAGPKNRMSKWLAAFAPIAQSYCAGRSNVSYGQLRRRAREWANQPNIGDRDWVLPQDDKSITNGIKKLEKLHIISIPRKAGA